MSSKLCGALLLAASIGLAVYLFSSASVSVFPPLSDYKPVDSLKNVTYLTAKSPSTPYLDIERDVYIPFGFETVKLTEPFATLRHRKPISCAVVFDEWLAIATAHDPKMVPPKVIPPELYSQYTMNGYAYVTERYINEKYDVKKAAVWQREDIEKRVSSFTMISNYPGEGDAVYHALKWHGIEGKLGMVIGSQNPWVEVMCLVNNASKVITAEYQNITMDHPQMGYIHPMQLAKNWAEYHEKYDFVVSFSSIEHSGLGRYGDPIDPIGDIREMQKMLCLLKRGGLMFLGFPVGLDGMAYNAHRYYGRIRLPMMFAGFELLTIFYGKNSKPGTITQDYLNGRHANQYLFVLRKL